MEKIDVGITAIVRPEILRRTMETFYNYVIVPNWNYEFRAVVHVDALGPHNTTPSTQMQEETAEVVKEFMQVDNVQLPVGPPSQHTALGRVWFQAKEEFMLHLEDDWIFHKPVFLMPCIDFLKQYPAASGVMFDRADCSVFDGCVSRLKGGTNRVAIRRCDVHGPPALLLQHYAKNLGALFLSTKRKGLPKKIIKRDRVIKGFLSKYPIAGIYMGGSGEGRVMSDIGREWRYHNNMKMKGRRWRKN